MSWLASNVGVGAGALGSICVFVGVWVEVGGKSSVGGVGAGVLVFVGVGVMVAVRVFVRVGVLVGVDDGGIAAPGHCVVPLKLDDGR